MPTPIQPMYDHDAVLIGKSVFKNIFAGVFALGLATSPLFAPRAEAYELKITNFLTCIADRIIDDQVPLTVAVRGGGAYDEHIRTAVSEWANAMQGAESGLRFSPKVEIAHSNVASGTSYDASVNDIYWDACLRVEIVDSLPGRTRIGEAFEYSTSFVGIRLLRGHGYAIVAHEIGHVIGLGHSGDPSAMMYPELHGQSHLHADDVEGVRALFRNHKDREKAGEEYRKRGSGNPANVRETVYEKRGMKCIHDKTADNFWAEYRADNGNAFSYHAFDGSEFKSSLDVCRKMVSSFSGRGVCVPGLSDRKWYPHDVTTSGSLKAFVDLSWKRGKTIPFEYQPCVEFVNRHGNE